MTTSQPHKTIRLILLIMILMVIQFSCTSRPPSPTDMNSIATIVAETLSAIPSITPTSSFSSTPELPTVSPTATFALTVNGQLQGILAFIRNDNLWVSMNGVEHQLTIDAISTELPYWTGSPQLWYSNPRISPNGTQVAYLKNTYDISTYEETAALVISDIDGANARQLTNDVAENLPAIAWSNDSQRIYYPVSNGYDVTTGLETITVKSVNPTAGDMIEHGQFSLMLGCGGHYPDIADHLSFGENIGRQNFAFVPQTNSMIHATVCFNGLGVLDLSANQERVLGESSVNGAVISPDGLRIAAISENNIVIFNVANGNIEQTFPTAESPQTVLWDDSGTIIFYSTAKPMGTRNLGETAASEVYNNSTQTITLNVSTLWKIPLDTGESIKIIDMDAHHLKPIFVRDQKMLVAAIENANLFFDYLDQGNRENLAEHYPSVNLVEIDLDTLTSNVIMQKTLQADYVSIR